MDSPPDKSSGQGSCRPRRRRNEICEVQMQENKGRDLDDLRINEI